MISSRGKLMDLRDWLLSTPVVHLKIAATYEICPVRKSITFHVPRVILSCTRPWYWTVISAVFLLL
jgi:hypothetical protein